MRLAVIPARGGSKRIPRKNVRLFAGKPIIAHSIGAALDSGCFDRVIVSTDDAEIAAVLSHVRSQWGNPSPPLDAASVAAARAASQSQSQPWAGAAALAQFR